MKLNLGKINNLFFPPPHKTGNHFKKNMRKHLNADNFFSLVLKDFQKIPDHRADNSKISFDDALMSALTVFQLKDPFLLAFDRHRRENPENLHAVFGINTILDPLDLSLLRAPFRSVFMQVQHNKDSEEMFFGDRHYLLSGDGAGYYSSAKMSSPYCLSKYRQ
jgi:hypothetical protein